MNLNLQCSCNLRQVSGYCNLPLGSPSTIPIVLWLELVIFNASNQDFAVLSILSKNCWNAVLVMLETIVGDLSFKAASQIFELGLRSPRLVIRSLLTQMVVLEGLLCSRISKPSSAKVVV